MKTLYTASLLTFLLFVSPVMAQHRGSAGAHVGHVGGYNHGIAPYHPNFNYGGQFPGNFNRAGYGYRPNVYNGLGYGYGFYASPYIYYNGNLGFGINCPYPYGSQAYANCFFSYYGYFPY